MIRINLLPVRAAKKKESVRFQLTVAGLITFMVLAVSFALYFSAGSEASALSAELRRGQDELVQLKKKIGELSKIKAQKKIVEDKLDVIKKLEAARTGPAELFDMISESIPDKAWIKSFKDRGPKVILQGYAASDEVVAEFMRRLQRNKRLKGVELEVVKSEVDRKTNIEIVSFVIRLEKGG
jgi:type IV pilus assembly protein PilN